MESGYGQGCGHRWHKSYLAASVFNPGDRVELGASKRVRMRESKQSPTAFVPKQTRPSPDKLKIGREGLEASRIGQKVKALTHWCRSLLRKPPSTWVRALLGYTAGCALTFSASTGQIWFGEPAMVCLSALIIGSLLKGKSSLWKKGLATAMTVGLALVDVQGAFFTLPPAGMSAPLHLLYHLGGVPLYLLLARAIHKATSVSRSSP